MKMPAFFSAKFQSHRRFSQAGTTDENAKEIIIENLYDILGSPNLGVSNNKYKHLHPPTSNGIDSTGREEMDSYKTLVKEHDGSERYIYNQDSYIKRVKVKAREYGLEIDKHIFIETNPGEIYIDETSRVYNTKYKITIKNLVIKVGASSAQMFFDKILGDLYLGSYLYNGGTYLVFENNYFVSSAPNRNAFFRFILGNDMYLIFRDNKFDAVDIYLTLKENVIIELTKNDIKNRHVTINGITDAVSYQSQWDTSSGVYFSSRRIMAARDMEEQVGENQEKIGGMSEKFIADIKKKVIEKDSEVNARDILKMLIYMDKRVRINPDDIELTRTNTLVRLADNAIVKLTIINTICFFRGSNTIKNLEISEDINHLYWGAYQNIDPEGKHAYNHKKMFINFIERAAKNNDKMQEARLRRELMKCERVLFRKEKGWRSWQDKFILWWSNFVSDYGISWLRPFLWLFIMNALFTGIIVCFFYHNSSWWILFAEFYNPLSHLSDTLNMKESNGLISSINIVQKAFLAIFLYEMIKIFRRFSK